MASTCVATSLLLVLVACSESQPSSQSNDLDPEGAPELTSCEVVSNERDRLSDALSGDLGKTASDDAISQLADSLSQSSDHESAIPGGIEGLRGDSADATADLILTYCENMDRDIAVDFGEMVASAQRAQGCEVVRQTALDYLGDQSPTERDPAETSRQAHALADLVATELGSDAESFTDSMRENADQMVITGDVFGLEVSWEVLDELCPAPEF